MTTEKQGQVKIFKRGKNNFRVALDDIAAELIQDNARKFVPGTDPRQPIFQCIPATHRGQPIDLDQHHIIPYPALGDALSELADKTGKAKWKEMVTNYLNDSNNTLAQAYFIREVTGTSMTELELPFTKENLTTDMLNDCFTGAVLYNPNNLIIGPPGYKRANDPGPNYEDEPQKLLGYSKNDLKKNVANGKNGILEVLTVKRAKIVKWNKTSQGFVMDKPFGPLRSNDCLDQSSSTRHAGRVYNIDTGLVEVPHAAALAVTRTAEDEKKSDDFGHSDSEKDAAENTLLESYNKKDADEGLEQLPLPVGSRRSVWQEAQQTVVNNNGPSEPFIDQVYTKVRSRLLQTGKEQANVHASQYGVQPPVVGQPFSTELVPPSLLNQPPALRIATAEAPEGETFPDDKKDVSIIDQIYEKVKELFQPSENQELQMEFPGRVLNEDKFKYDTKSVYSTVTKPRPVAEQEFLLSNDMYDSSKLSGGPNGKHISSSYQTALNMLIPRMSNLDTVYKDRQKLRDWLNTEVEDEVDGKDFKGSRMALYQKLLKRYEEAKETWEKTRVRKLKKATASGNPKDMEDYALWLANVGEPNLKKVESYFDDLVVRGFYHEVRDFISYLDISSPTAALKEAKDSMRASASMSLDESQTIYPVQMQPNNWSEGLSTDFKPVDLCMDPEFIKLQLMQKMKELQTLQSKVQKLRSVSTGDPRQMQGEVEQAQNALDDAHLEALNNFTDAALEAAKLAYEAYQDKHADKDFETALNDFTELGKQSSGGEDDPNVAIKEHTGSSFSAEDFDKFADFQKKALKNQVQLEQANRKLVFMMEAKAQAEVTSTDQARLDIEKQIKTVKLDIKNLKELAYAKGSTTTAMSVQGTDDISSIPDSPAVDHFMDVVMKFDASSNRSKSKLSSSAETSQSTAALLFGSVGTSSGSSTGDFKENNFSSASSIEIGFRATKVSIQRGGWFQPELFDASTDMYRMGDAKFNDMFPNYPTAFVLVKDVTIKVKMNSHQSGTASEYLNKHSSKSGGFLCFGASSSSSSSSNSHSSYSGVTSDGIIIRIPGPQILVWVLETVATDKSQKYPADQSVIPDTLLNPIFPERQLTDSADSHDP